MHMTKGKREISKLTAEVKTHGNGAHVIVPKDWIGMEVEIIPISYIQNKVSEQAVKDTSAAVWEAVKGERRKRKK